MEKINANHWMSCYKEVSKTYPEKEVRENFAMGLFNATSDYGNADKFDEMELCLKELRELHLKYPEKEVRENLAKGMFNATNHYGKADKV